MTCVIYAHNCSKPEQGLLKLNLSMTNTPKTCNFLENYNSILMCNVQLNNSNHIKGVT